MFFIFSMRSIYITFIIRKTGIWQKETAGQRSSDWAGLWDCSSVKGHLDFHPNSWPHMSSHYPQTRTWTSTQQFHSSAHKCFSEHPIPGSKWPWSSSWTSLHNQGLWLPGQFAFLYTRKVLRATLVPKFQSPYLGEIISTSSLSNSQTWLLLWACWIFSPSKDQVWLN